MPRLKSACPLPFRVRGIPVRRPTLLPPASFRRTLLQHPCLRLSFPSVRVDLDFARYTCHNTRHHHLAAGPSPAHIGIGRSIAAPPSHTTQHTGPYCAIRLIRQVQLQGNESPSDVKCLSGKAILTHLTLLIRQGPYGHSLSSRHSFEKLLFSRVHPHGFCGFSNASRLTPEVDV